MGVVETLFSTALCGVIFALAGGQPLVIVGVTGPVVILVQTIYSISQSAGVDFMQFYSWIGARPSPPSPLMEKRASWRRRR